MTTGDATAKLGWAHARDPEALIVCGLGTGFLPSAPGTWGSLLAVVIWWFVLSPLAWPAQLAVIAVTYLLGTLLTWRVQRRYGVSDDGAIVIDEVVGQWLALLMLPAEPLLVAFGFGLFRLFDILKPGPVRYLERRLGGATGVMADDVLAGLIACAVLQVTLFGLGLY